MLGFILGGTIGFILGVFVASVSRVSNSEIATKLANTMNGAMLQCVTEKIITKDQVYDIETVFHKQIEANFKGIKACHSEKVKKD